MISITLLTERALSSVITIAYDRTIPGEDEKAMECHDQLLKKLTVEGYFPYRLGIQSMDKLPGSEESSIRLLKTLKAAFDPTIFFHLAVISNNWAIKNPDLYVRVWVFYLLQAKPT